MDDGFAGDRGVLAVWWLWLCQVVVELAEEEASVNSRCSDFPFSVDTPY